MPTPRPHYKERIAHAEGHEIQWRFDDQDTWDDIEEPGWCEEYQYRVKPEPKPDVVHVTRVYLAGFGFKEIHNLVLEGCDHNLRLTFDGETGTLKSAEVIQQS